MDTETDSEPAQTNPIACTLATEEAADRVVDWVDLQRRCSEVARIDRGVQMTFPASMLSDVEELARRESACCAFLTISTSVIDDVLIVDISSQSPEALPVIEALAGMPCP